MLRTAVVLRVISHCLSLAQAFQTRGIETALSSRNTATFDPIQGAAAARRPAGRAACQTVLPVGGGGMGNLDPRYLQYDITLIQGPQDFLDFLAQDDRLCIVFVRANWCQICKHFSAKWKKMANTYGDKFDPNTGQVALSGFVRFAEIEFTEHEELCRRLKASRMPHVLIYRGNSGMAGKIVQYQCGPSAFGLVVDSLEYLLAGPPVGIPPPWLEFVAAQEAMLREKEARDNGS